MKITIKANENKSADDKIKTIKPAIFGKNTFVQTIFTYDESKDKVNDRRKR